MLFLGANAADDCSAAICGIFLWEPHFVIHDDKKCVFLYRNPAWSSFKFKVFNELVQPQTLLDYADMQSSCSHFYLCQSRCILSTRSALWRQVKVVRCTTLMQVLPDLPPFKVEHVAPQKLQEEEGGKSGKYYQITTMRSAVDTRACRNILIYSLIQQTPSLLTEAKPHYDKSCCFTLSLPTLPETPTALSMSQIFSPVFSARHIKRHLWYSQGVKIKAESLSTSCSATTHFPWQPVEGRV